MRKVVLFIGGALLTYLVHLPWKLVEAFVFDRIIQALPELGSTMDPLFSNAVFVLVSWGPPVVFASAVIWAIYKMAYTSGQKDAAPKPSTPSTPSIFADEIRKNVFLKMERLSLQARHEMCRSVRREIEIDQLSFEIKREFQDVGFVAPIVGFAVAKLNEQYRPFVEEWCSKNQS